MNSLSIAFAALELVAPAPDSTLRLLPDCQIAVITNETREVRESVLAGEDKDGTPLAKCDGWRKSLPVKFVWRASAGEKGPWQIKIGVEPSRLDEQLVLLNDSQVKKDGDLRRYEAKGLNLEIGRRYYYQVFSNIACGAFDHDRDCTCTNRPPSAKSAVGSFVTEDLAPRWIRVDGKVSNFRDLGGRRGLGGRRVRQGAIYRSQGLNDNSVDGLHAGRNRLTVEDVKELTGRLGIRTDLDLRTAKETAHMAVSPLGERINFVHRSSKFYDGIFTPEGKAIMAENFRLFCDRSKYPILFHCIGGADRTGALGYVLNGVLGVSRQELETDWESTFYPKIPMYEKGNPDKLVWNSEMHFNNGFGAYGDENTSWNDRIVLYLKDCGITDGEIETFRQIMLK